MGDPLKAVKDFAAKPSGKATASAAAGVPIAVAVGDSVVTGVDVGGGEVLAQLKGAALRHLDTIVVDVLSNYAKIDAQGLSNYLANQGETITGLALRLGRQLVKEFRGQGSVEERRNFVNDIVATELESVKIDTDGADVVPAKLAFDKLTAVEMAEIADIVNRTRSSKEYLINALPGGERTLVELMGWMNLNPQIRNAAEHLDAMEGVVSGDTLVYDQDNRVWKL